MADITDKTTTLRSAIVKVSMAETMEAIFSSILHLFRILKSAPHDQQV